MKDVIQVFMDLFANTVTLMIWHWLGFCLLNGKIVLHTNRFFQGILGIGCSGLSALVLLLAEPLGMIRWILVAAISIVFACLLSEDKWVITFFWTGFFDLLLLLTLQISERFLLFCTSWSTEQLNSRGGEVLVRLLAALLVLLLVQLLISEYSAISELEWYVYGAFAFEMTIGIVVLGLCLNQLQVPSGDWRENTLYYAVFLLGILLISIGIQFYLTGRVYRQNLQMIQKEQQMESEGSQYRLVLQTNGILRTWKHDFRNHMNVLSVMAQTGSREEISSYLDLISDELEKSRWSVCTGNNAIDAVLSGKMNRIREEGIRFEYTVFLPETVALDQLQWTALLGNLMDNAIEGCMGFAEEQKLRFGIPEINGYRYQEGYEPIQPDIQLEIKPVNHFVSILVSNSTCGKYVFDRKGNLKSTKKEAGHGIGLRRIQNLVEEKSGIWKIEPGEERFSVHIMLPLVINNQK